ncbi:MAG: hypothetical protein UV95_C0003G0021 [Candidatus Falkowbacteria bacterium GW2011_GWF2_43_32]|nr:MAG: hypothetical protein UV95_C0003G0021 [Candidatus Falkowbacteria bacterium GW2011_GWF2_43_32]
MPAFYIQQNKTIISLILHNIYITNIVLTKIFKYDKLKSQNVLQLKRKIVV